MQPSTDKALEDLVGRGAAEIGLTLEKQQIQKLVQYLRLLEKWNRTYNLTAIRDLAQMVSKHVLDSLAVLPVLDKQDTKCWIDVGSGAGLPGVPLAIARPDWQMTLMDSNNKKASFLRQVVTACNLSNVTVVEDRAECHDLCYPGVIARAFASVGEAIQMVAGLMAPGASLWLMKGKFPEDELPGLSKPYRVSASYRLQVPGVDGERHLLKITRDENRNISA